MSDTPTLDEYRTGYLSERYGISDNAARALQVAELGYSASGIAKVLGVTEGTASGYLDTIRDEISPKAGTPPTSNDERLDVWGERDLSEIGSSTYEQGVNDAREKGEPQFTDSKEQVDPQFRKRTRMFNFGSYDTLAINLIAPQSGVDT